MNQTLLDLYSDYLLSSFGQTTATGLAQLLEGAVSHDQITRMLAGEMRTNKTWWKMVKPHVRNIQEEDGVMIVDDSIAEKPYTDENDIICWHYDHSKGRSVKGINFVTTLYVAQGVALPVTFEIVTKTETYLDTKSGKEKRKSPVTKNEQYRQMLKQMEANQIPFKYVLNDLWFASAENMNFVKKALKKEFIMGLKTNRKIALSAEDKRDGNYQRIDELEISEGHTRLVYLEQVSFPLLLIKQVFKNENGTVGVRYLVSSDLTLAHDDLITIFQKRWKVEEYHRSLKQTASLSKSPTRTLTTQQNHFVASLWSFVKLELLKVQTKKNHYQLKNHLYLSALKQAFYQLQQLHPIALGFESSA
jgi:hypothetical protein